MFLSKIKKIFSNSHKSQQKNSITIRNSHRRKCILVVGMHRSGTSAMSAILKIAGIYNNVTNNVSPDNPKGFFEWHKGMDVNGKIFRLFRSEWDDERQRPYTTKKRRKVEKFKNEIIQAIDEDFNNQDIFAIKDPRISVLLPIYLEIFESINIEPLLIMMERPDEEIYLSLKKRNNFSRKKSYSLCKKYKGAVYENISKCNHIIVNFEELVSEPVKTAEKIIDKFNLPLSIDDKCKNEILEFIEPGLKHHNIVSNNPGTVIKKKDGM